MSSKFTPSSSEASSPSLSGLLDEQLVAWRPHRPPDFNKVQELAQSWPRLRLKRLLTVVINILGLLVVLVAIALLWR